MRIRLWSLQQFSRQQRPLQQHCQFQLRYFRMSAPAAAAGTHKDELTGEMVSKSELKRRMQQRQKAEAKASKAPAAAQGAGKAKAVSAADQEAELNPNVRFEAELN